VLLSRRMQQSLQERQLLHSQQLLQAPMSTVVLPLGRRVVHRTPPRKQPQGLR
jgi:hypothetical protein